MLEKDIGCSISDTYAYVRPSQTLRQHPLPTHTPMLQYGPNGDLFESQRARDGRLTAAEFFHFALQISSALTHMHSLGFAHCDVKPENCLLADKRTLKLGVFVGACVQSSCPIPISKLLVTAALRGFPPFCVPLCSRSQEHSMPAFSLSPSDNHAARVC